MCTNMAMQGCRAPGAPENLPSLTAEAAQPHTEPQEGPAHGPRARPRGRGDGRTTCHGLWLPVPTLQRDARSLLGSEGRPVGGLEARDGTRGAEQGTRTL